MDGRVLGLAGVTAWLALGLMGCTAPPDAPTELADLSRYLYEHWADDDPAAMEEGLRNLADFLADKDLEGNVNDRSWALEPLEPSDVADIDRPEDRALEDCVSVAVSRRSPWPVVDHARVQVSADQRPFEPTAKDHYDRFFPEQDDPACFLDRGCPELVSFNEATRKNLVLEATFELHKRFRWFDLSTPEEPDRGWAIVAQSWFSEPWPGAREKVTLWQSYSLDIWMEQPDQTTWRFQTLWSETDLGVAVGDDTVIATIKLGTDDVFKHGDEVIGEMFHGGEAPQ